RSPPGTQMHFIDGHWCGQGLAISSVYHPFPVMPFVARIPNDRGGSRGHFAIERKGVCFFDSISVVTGDHVVLVHGPGSQAGEESLPNTGASPRGEGMLCLVPVIEVAHDVHLLSIGSPDRK